MGFLAHIVLVVMVMALNVQEIEPRTVNLSGPDGDVSLVEVLVDGTIRGRCSFNDGGEEIEVMYEESNGKVLIAKSLNPTVLDPEAKATKCKNAASANLRGRSTIGGSHVPETREELEIRLQNFQNKMAINQQYVSSLRPRFIPIPIPISTGTNNNNGFIVQPLTGSSTPLVNFLLPTNNVAGSTITKTLGFPFFGR